MDIDFCGTAGPANDGGVSFRTKVDGNTITCHITSIVLEDIDPHHNQDNPMSQFQAHREFLLSIAENKIRKGEISDHCVMVCWDDLRN